MSDGISSSPTDGLPNCTVLARRGVVIDVEDAEETLGDIAVGIIQDEVERTTWAQIRTPEFRKRCLKQIQKQARKWGISVSTVKFQDITQAETYNLFGVSQ